MSSIRPELVVAPAAVLAEVAIEGRAELEALPGGLVVGDGIPGVDGTVVLRYHSVPCLNTAQPTPWDPPFLEQDPTPFIRLHPTVGSVALEIRFPPELGRGPGH